MKEKELQPLPINSVAAYHEFMGLPKPKHPLISVVRFEDMCHPTAKMPYTLLFNFYSIALKKDYNGKIKYGQNIYDFDSGVMAFFSPGQAVTISGPDKIIHNGWLLIFHPDFLWGYPLAKNIKKYGYFLYALHEALHLSEEEEAIVTDIKNGIVRECSSPIDSFSQNVMIAQLEVLFSLAERFYNRQFITRKIINHQVVERMEMVLNEYLVNDIQHKGLPTVQYIAQQLNISPDYLSDLLKKHTGQNAQQHIHNKIIDAAKEKLSITGMSVSEIAFQLGFEHPQSFNKLFKNKTGFSPVEFRNSVN